MSSSSQFQCGLSNDDRCEPSLSNGTEGAMISVRGSITLSSGHYLPHGNGNYVLSHPFSSEDSSTPCSTYTSFSCATPTLSGLLNTPLLNQQASNLLKCVDVSSATATTPHLNSQSLNSLSNTTPNLKNRNIVAANPLLAGNQRILQCLNL